MFLCNVSIQPQDHTLTTKSSHCCEDLGTCFMTDFLQQYLTLWCKSQFDTFLAKGAKNIAQKMVPHLENV
jgi:hypothetical protein